MANINSNRLTAQGVGRLVQGVIDGVAEGRREVFNPVYLYGEQADVAAVLDLAVSEFKRKNPEKRVTRADGEGFIEGLIQGISNGDERGYIKSIAACDLLAFEGIEAIAGKEFTMQRFYGLFDDVFEAGGQILIGGAVAPSELLRLEDRVLTQLEAGIICSIYD